MYGCKDGNLVPRYIFVQPRDSGSFVVDKHGRMVALLTDDTDFDGQSIVLIMGIGFDVEVKIGGKVWASVFHSIG